MKYFFKRWKPSWMILMILLVGSLSFPATREAQVLIIRLLLHLKGTTFVQGQPSGCIGYMVPNVQFTEKHQKELRIRSNQSLDDYALAIVIENETESELPPPRLELPPMEVSWTNHPLLNWAAFHMAGITGNRIASLNSTNYPITNTAALSFLKNTHATIHLAQTVNATNGALWLAEACVDFDEGRDEAALVALKYAATNRNWNATSATEFSHINKLLLKSGLPPVDAAIAAHSQSCGLDVLGIQGKNLRNLERLLTAAVNNKNEPAFSGLLQLLVELRRAEWSDKNMEIRNNFRRSQLDDELIDAMAKQMENPLMSNTNHMGYQQRREIQKKVAQDYIRQHSDMGTVASFIAQNECHVTERTLRSRLSEMKFRSLIWAGVWSSLYGIIAAFSLSSLVITLLFAPLICSLQKIPAGVDFFPRSTTFWTMAFVAVFASSLIFVNFWAAVGLDNTVGFGPAEPSPLINPMLQIFLVSSGLLGFILATSIVDWKRKKLTSKSWKHLALYSAMAYLICIFAMAFFRSQAVDEITSGIL
jgi:hypothetical protein